jgi:hypothetical protein
MIAGGLTRVTCPSFSTRHPISFSSTITRPA